MFRELKSGMQDPIGHQIPWLMLVHCTSHTRRVVRKVQYRCTCRCETRAFRSETVECMHGIPGREKAGVLRWGRHGREDEYMYRAVWLL
jgi:hypothetical protein